MSPFSAIDIDWAWSAFEPTPDTPWDLRRAAHLYRRAGFCVSSRQLNEALKSEPGLLVGQLVSGTEPASFAGQMSRLVQATLGIGDVRQLAAQWAYRMLNTPVPLLEKMTLFWHGHFATSAAKVEDAELMLAQNHLLRRLAFGDFKELLLEISRDPAMLIYLDSVSNRKAHPNENYAREIMELFCLGEGNYSEQDVRELARCFTGWEIKRKRFRFNRYQHDTGKKTLFGRTGIRSGEDGVSAVVDQPSSPRFIVSKLVRFFVVDEPAPPISLIEPLAVQLREDDMRIEPTIRRILGSNLFFSDDVIGRKVRSPVEFGIGFLRALDGSTDSFELAASFERLGQGLFYPPSVKGWDGGRTWINSSTLLGRSNLIRALIENPKTRFAKQSLNDYLAGLEIRTAEQLIEHFETILFAVPIPADVKERVTTLYRGTLGGRMIAGKADERTKEAVHVLCTLPEFQLA